MKIQTASTQQKPAKLLVALAMLAFVGCGHALAKTPYKTSGQCDGLPRIAVETPAGFCVGLLADGFKFPRGILPHANGDLYVADMAGWIKGKGSIWKLTKRNGIYARSQLFKNLDRPNGLALGPDGRIYVGTVGRIFRFDPADPAATATDIIGGTSQVPPLPGTGRHPLTQMAFDKQGNLFVNVGSATDNCEGENDSHPDPGKPCQEAEGTEPRGAIRKYTLQWPEGKVQGWVNFAVGLRNSMALAVHPESGELWQAENSRDAISKLDPALNDEELPHDELNLVREHLNYGWPYCYDNNVASPEYRQWDCSRHTKPEILLPAHAAPLGMVFHAAKKFPPPLANALIIGFHGYRAAGHRVVAYPFSANGKPSGKPVELIRGWGATKSSPMGAPVDVRIGADGAIYISEDRNGTVLRLVYTGASSR